MVDDDRPRQRGVARARRPARAPRRDASAVRARYPAEVAPFGAVDVLDDDAWADLGNAARTAAPTDAVTAVLFRAESDRPRLPGGRSRSEAGAARWSSTTLVPAPRSRRHAPLAAADVAADARPRRAHAARARSAPAPSSWAATTACSRAGGWWPWRVSGSVCRGSPRSARSAPTPTSAGRGLASGLTTLVARAILERGETPFLHHADGNDAARRVYEALGFRDRVGVRFVSFRPPPVRGG